MADPSTFTFIPSMEYSHFIQNADGVILTYYLHLPSHLHIIKSLTESEDLISQIGVAAHTRGISSVWHWALWVDFQKRKKCFMSHVLSAEYRRDNTGANKGRADKWLRTNHQLFDYLKGTVLQNISPRIYEHFHKVGKSFGSSLPPLFEIWVGCAIVQNMEVDGNTHLDWFDKAFDLNAVVRWGEFEIATVELATDWALSQ